MDLTTLRELVSLMKAEGICRLRAGEYELELHGSPQPQPSLKGSPTPLMSGAHPVEGAGEKPAEDDSQRPSTELDEADDMAVLLHSSGIPVDAFRRFAGQARAQLKDA